MAEDKDEDILKKSEENLREKGVKIVDEGKSREIIKRSGASALAILRKPIVIILIIAAIALIVFLLYTHSNVSDQSYKIENYETLWNQSLADFRSGNLTIQEYCINRVHDIDFCDRFWSLQYFN